MNVTTKAARARLKPRRDPYWVKLAPGWFVGYRAGAGTWIARYRDRKGRQHFSSMGESEDFEAVKSAASAWCRQLAGGAVSTLAAAKRGTVREALGSYLEHLRRGGRGAAAVIADQKFSTTVYGDLLAEIPVQQLTREDFESWRERLRKAENGGKRQNQSINRYATAVSAALNCAVDVCGYAGTRAAWKLGRLPVERTESGDGEAVYLSKAQRERLLKCAEWPALQLFLRALYASAARPNEIANARVSDYDPVNNTLVLATMKGRPAILRKRSVQLEPREALLFRQLCEGKKPSDPLCTDATGLPWQRHRWAAQIRAAVVFANASAKPADQIPAGASAYSFRHSRISELLQIYNVDPVTVAHQTGTSLAMMQLYYWKFIPSAIIEKFTAHDLQAQKKRAK